MGMFAAIYFFSAMKPGRYRSGLPADGGRIINLLRGGPGADRWCALVALSGADLRGRRPRDWDEALVQQALTGYDHSYDGRNARLVAYRWALDHGRIADANLWLEEAVAIRPTWMTGLQAQVAWEKAYFTAYHLRDPVQARAWLNKVRSSAAGQPTHLRAEAAVLLAEGDRQGAEKSARMALALIQRATPTGIRQAEAAWLRPIIEQG